VLHVPTGIDIVRWNSCAVAERLCEATVVMHATRAKVAACE